MAQPKQGSKKPQRKGHQVRQNTQQVTKIEQSMHQGPIPDPKTLAGYNTIVPDAAERILTMAENEAVHRQSLESDTLNANIKDRMAVRLEVKIGQILAFLLCLFVVVCGAYIAINGAEWPGVVLGSTGLSGIIVAYLKK